MPIPFLRYFCTVTSQEDLDKDSWGDIGWDYFIALKERFPKLRVFANGLLHQVHISKTESRWGKFGELFGTPVEGPYINVVCGSKEVLSRYFTREKTTLLNVAITTLNGDILNDHFADQVKRQWEAHNKEADKYGDADKRTEASSDDPYRKYDLVICLTTEDVIALKASGVVAKHLQPSECADAICALLGLDEENLNASP